MAHAIDESFIFGDRIPLDTFIILDVSKRKPMTIFKANFLQFVVFAVFV